MGIGGKDGGDVPPKEDMEQFLELRRHVKRMQAGTPLLLRIASDSGQEQLQICTFFVTQDLQTLRWKDQEGSGTVHEVPMSAVVEVSEDSTTSSSILPGRKGEDSHHGLTLTLRKGERNATTEMGLICASPEDLISWREGLKFLIVAQPGPVVPSPAASTSSRVAKASSPVAASSSKVVSGVEEDLRRKLAQEKEANEKLRLENEMLKETIKRKDATINELVRDAQSQAVKDRSIKTESTSRESDQHLHDREVAILQRKNQRLRKALKAKQQTVAELLKLVGKVTAQQGLESSAVEDIGDDDEDEANSDSVGPASSARGAAAVVGRQRKPSAAPTKLVKPAVVAAVGAGEGDGAASDEGGMDDDDDDSEPEAVKEEMRQLMASSSSPQAASGLAELLAGGLLDESSGGGLPPGGAAQLLQALLEGAAAANASAAGTAPAAATRPAATTAPAAATAPAAGANGAARGQGSAAALQALDRELELLEEKKRVVERLARLEPPSDNEEEDDGFPLGEAALQSMVANWRACAG
eukprot:CAMPEP_0115537764 /NCGR_PEP_ID=MMETSP0271-20121206/88502_1 /TAXON_ID=71861 /ORGANISM="Scrippsiella trochoidea, Strain CCMP3099" /LENGTH=527 /DNA_ID=CAMNT_0002970581 /DNA_START=70 /DNA_END=1650 /DNA_ORIENTATION=-